MGLGRSRAKTPRPLALLVRALLCGSALLLAVPACEAFNLDVEKPAVYSGPNGSYFGYAVDFYLADAASVSLVIGAPKANTKQVNITEGGSVFYCPWSLSQRDCHTIDFDTEGKHHDRAVGGGLDVVQQPDQILHKLLELTDCLVVMADLLVGAPMFMVRSSDGRLEEMGRVYLYLQRGAVSLELRLPNLTGTQVYGRFGSTIAPLGDLNQDGFNDVAISCPFGGEDRQGLVYIFNGYSGGLREKPSQVITGQWAAGAIPASFGFSLRGAKDLDMNGYPDLIVGAFGVNKAVLYSVNLSFCITADGKHLPDTIDFQVEVQLDSNKHKQKGAVRRALFLDSQQPLLEKSVSLRHGERWCHNPKIYLRAEKDFRDKLSSIYVALNFSLDPKAAADSHGLRPILNYQTTNVIEQKAQILLDCGEDNICVPDLKLTVHGNRKEVYLGDDNSLTLTFNAKNEGEGGAYEAELYVVLPPEADYSGIARNNESLSQLTCRYDTENQTQYLSCDLGNPMKSGTSLWAGLRFTVPRLKDTHKTVQFELQIRRYNLNFIRSLGPSYTFSHIPASLLSVSRPDKVFFPPANWKVTKTYEAEQDVGPAVEHIYELVNNGPSRISNTLLKLHCPLRVQGQTLLYPLEFSVEGPINCTSDKNMNHLRLKVSRLQHTSTEPPVLALQAHEHRVERRDVQRNPLAHMTNLSCSNTECWKLQCTVGLLEKGNTAILKVRSRIWAETFTEVSLKVCRRPQVVTPVVWNKPDLENSVPLWIIILAILAGLLLLALLIYVLYKVSAPANQSIGRVLVF
uniref:Integrin, alpha 5 (fibronectin receptor, alpha polypeptide) n=1 Tax=Gasterosteus aculeatus aculeatus TaxID=481459 RepID=A0AAQ4R2H9_GASAC